MANSGLENNSSTVKSLMGVATLLPTTTAGYQARSSMEKHPLKRSIEMIRKPKVDLRKTIQPNEDIIS
jgi:hypothetical protein